MYSSPASFYRISSSHPTSTSCTHTRLFFRRERKKSRRKRPKQSVSDASLERKIFLEESMQTFILVSFGIESSVTVFLSVSLEVKENLSRQRNQESIELRREEKEGYGLENFSLCLRMVCKHKQNDTRITKKAKRERTTSN